MNVAIPSCAPLRVRTRESLHGGDSSRFQASVLSRRRAASRVCILSCGCNVKVPLLSPVQEVRAGQA
jgi:hypothetical protein